MCHLLLKQTSDTVHNPVSEKNIMYYRAIHSETYFSLFGMIIREQCTITVAFTLLIAVQRGS